MKRYRFCFVIRAPLNLIFKSAPAGKNFLVLFQRLKDGQVFRSFQVDAGLHSDSVEGVRAAIVFQITDDLVDFGSRIGHTLCLPCNIL